MVAPRRHYQVTPPEIILAIRTEIENGSTLRYVAAKYGMTVGRVAGICSRNNIKSKNAPVLMRARKERLPIQDVDLRPMTGKCRWPMWEFEEKPTQQFCDTACPVDKPYCDKHSEIAYQRRPANE